MLATLRNGRGAKKNAEACGGVACVRIVGPSSVRISLWRDESELYNNDRELVF